VTAENLKQIAIELARQLKEDISKAVTREEHIRMTARANEAHHLMQHLHNFFAHTNGIMTGSDNEDLSTDRDD